MKLVGEASSLPRNMTPACENALPEGRHFLLDKLARWRKILLKKRFPQLLWPHISVSPFYVADPTVEAA